MKRSAIKRHAVKRKPGDVDREYMAWIKTLPCSVETCLRSCERFDLVMTAYDREMCEIEAHHAGDHGYAQRAPDRTCIPLCVYHHREGPESAHRIGKHFWAHHGLDRDALIERLNREYDSL